MREAPGSEGQAFFVSMKIQQLEEELRKTELMEVHLCHNVDGDLAITTSMLPPLFMKVQGLDVVVKRTTLISRGSAIRFIHKDEGLCIIHQMVCKCNPQIQRFCPPLLMYVSSFNEDVVMHTDEGCLRPHKAQLVKLIDSPPQSSGQLGRVYHHFEDMASLVHIIGGEDVDNLSLPFVMELLLSKEQRITEVPCIEQVVLSTPDSSRIPIDDATLESQIIEVQTWNEGEGHSGPEVGVIDNDGKSDKNLDPYSISPVRNRDNNKVESPESSIHSTPPTAPATSTQ
ncbi:hypothetical protein M758_UG269700 [Ceratodon purpureus]|nr:hypothetical protein M758_UG269700 [Ceratodon purpureus]